jgi:hypothetical protein
MNTSLRQGDELETMGLCLFAHWVLVSEFHMDLRLVFFSSLGSTLSWRWAWSADEDSADPVVALAGFGGR